MDIIDQVKERLSIFKNFYDVIRIVNPVKKKTTLAIENKVQELNETCYALWKKDTFCENCISMRAYINNDTFIKIEYDKEKIILIIATSIKIDGKVFIVEILKDITQNSSVLHKLTEGSNSVKEQISSMNEKVVKDDLTRLYNRRYINERLPVDINYSIIDYHIETSDLLSKVDENLYEAKGSGRNRTIKSQENVNEVGVANINNKSMKLSQLNKQINEVREILNDVCCTLDASETKPDRLTISQYLDELIVEYMKETNNTK